MNTSMIRYTLGHVLRLEGLFLFLPLIIALMYQEQSGVYFLIVAIICFLVGLLLSFRKPKNTVFYLKEGCIITSLSWIVLSIFGFLTFFV